MGFADLTRDMKVNHQFRAEDSLLHACNIGLPQRQLEQQCELRFPCRQKCAIDYGARWYA